MLELRNVWKRYSGIPAVEDVSFSARAGEVTGYLGANGSGKSTTMKMITGLINMSLGSILFQGKPIQDDLMAYKQRIGYVPEETYLYAHLSGVVAEKVRVWRERRRPGPKGRFFLARIQGPEGPCSLRYNKTTTFSAAS